MKMKKINLSISAALIVLILTSTSVLAYNMGSKSNVYSMNSQNVYSMNSQNVYSMNGHYNFNGMHHTMNSNNIWHNSHSSMHYYPGSMQNKINMREIK